MKEGRPDRGPFPGAPLLTRLQAQADVRWFAAIALGLGAILGRSLLGFHPSLGPLLFALGGAVAGFNLWVLRMLRRAARPQEEYPDRELVRLASTTIVVDYVFLTLAVWGMGGARSPFLAFYIIHAVLSGFLLSRRMALASTAAAFFLLTLLAVGEAAGLIPAQPVAGMLSASVEAISWRSAATVLVAYGLLLGFTAWLVIGVSESLRHGQRELERKNEELDRLSDLRQDFLRIVLHNLRSPLGAAIMHMRNLVDGLGGGLNDRQMEWARRSMTRMRGLSDFLRDLQVLSLLDAGEVEEQAGPVPVGPLIRELISEHADQAAARGHTLDIVPVPDDLPDVRGIPRLMREALVNYLTNALKYTPKGGRIEMRAFRARGRVCIEVADTGVGVPQEKRNRLFGEMVRLEDIEVDGEKPEGTGLGLAIVRRIVEMQGGEVGMYPAPGGGSVFYMDLPAA